MTEEATVPEPIVSDSARAEQARRSVPVAVGVALVLSVLLAVVAQRVSAQTSRDHHRQVATAAAYLAGPNALAAERAAVTETRATLTYSYKTLASDFAAAEKGLTPSFRSSYLHTTATSVQPLAVKYHAISSATVTGAGVSAASADTATVLVFVDQTVRNTQLPRPRLDRSRISVGMQKLNGHWLVNHLSPL
jgi:Mce-associated membrane protein